MTKPQLSSKVFDWNNCLQFLNFTWLWQLLQELWLQVANKRSSLWNTLAQSRNRNETTHLVHRWWQSREGRAIYLGYYFTSPFIRSDNIERNRASPLFTKTTVGIAKNISHQPYMPDVLVVGSISVALVVPVFAKSLNVQFSGYLTIWECVISLHAIKRWRNLNPSPLWGLATNYWELTGNDWTAFSYELESDCENVIVPLTGWPVLYDVKV